MTKTIVIMAKAPFPGQAKTRLAAAIGAEEAARLHRAFLSQSIATALASGDAKVALMAPDERHAASLATIAPAGVEVWAQKRPSLMAGISQGFERAFAAGAELVVVSETDSANLPGSYLTRCFELLGGSRPALALGPCSDGGYYLAGAAGLSDDLARALFEGETYDSSTICRRTADRAVKLGLRVEMGPEWYDVDTIDDLQRMINDLDRGPKGSFDSLRQAIAATRLPAVDPA
ncbi:MAG: TIGR04282 family arsenosugar biosynthesis glycosyltransferase [Chloroflexi bacterium]|nr:TIGR04282 family arsenosugar biosynthesis glycosyltransferase [Chloroflexota bacterium]